MKRIATLLACHNRKAKTLSCLESLYRSTLSNGYLLDVFVVDDGSTDGTSDAVKTFYPAVNLIAGDGTLFWNGGMHVAFGAALAKGYDFYLWINDDTLLYPTTLQSLLATTRQLVARKSKDVIVVGSAQDESSGQITYGGLFRPSKFKPTAFKLIAPSDEPVECETMNGNCVLIPSAIAQEIGNMDKGFAHAMGDLDYGLRARNAGFSIWVMPNFAGTCSKNAVAGSFNDASLSATVRLRKMLQPKGLPPASWRIFTRRHAGIFWPFYWVWPYLKVVLRLG